MTKPSPAEITSNTDVKSYLDRAMNILDDMETLAQDKKELFTEAKASGIDMKAFNIALRELRKPLDPALKKIANCYLESKGQFLLFA